MLKNLQKDKKIKVGIFGQEWVRFDELHAVGGCIPEVVVCSLDRLYHPVSYGTRCSLENHNQTLTNKHTHYRIHKQKKSIKHAKLLFLWLITIFNFFKIYPFFFSTHKLLFYMHNTPKLLKLFLPNTIKLKLFFSSYFINITCTRNNKL